MRITDKLVSILAVCVIGFGLILSARFALRGDIYFHTDIARDFLVLEEIVSTKKPTLIGPRSGGISGVFHGPLWFYFSLPAFLLGSGSPSFIAWFWMLLIIASVILIYLVASKIFNRKVGLVSAALLSLASINYAHNLFNPFGAVLLSPVFIYFLIQYIKIFHISDLILSLLILGILFQFQMAFAAPLIALTIPLIVYVAIKNKRLSHVLYLPVVCIPLITFILFDIRHDFLQTKAVIAYLTNTEVEDFELLLFLKKRIDAMLLQGFNIISASQIFLKIWLVFTAVIISIQSIRLRSNSNNLYFLLFLFFYFGYWIVTLFYTGELWSYYWWPFLPLTIIFIVAGLHQFFKRFANQVLIVLMLSGSFFAIVQSKQVNSFIGEDGGSWQFHKKLAEDIFSDAEEDFGYFIYTPDQYGYSSKYALESIAKDFNSIEAKPYEKHGLTYLIYAPPPDDKPELDGVWWKLEQVRISSEPIDILFYENGYRIEKYLLTDDEVAIPADQNLITDLHFR